MLFRKKKKLKQEKYQDLASDTDYLLKYILHWGPTASFEFKLIEKSLQVQSTLPWIQLYVKLTDFFGNSNIYPLNGAILCTLFEASFFEFLVWREYVWLLKNWVEPPLTSSLLMAPKYSCRLTGCTCRINSVQRKLCLIAWG